MSTSVNLLVAIGLVLFAQYTWDHIAHDPERAAAILNISQLPPSASQVRCRSTCLTDLCMTCAFSIAPADFQSLLGGRNFQIREQATNTGVYEISSYVPDVGENFIVGAYASEGLPELEAPHGGSVQIYTNAARDRVLVYNYIE